MLGTRLWLVAAILAGTVRAADPPPRPPENDDPARRLEWARERREFPGDGIPPHARRKALEQLERLKEPIAPLAAPPNLPSVWVPIGPAPIQNGQSLNFPNDPEDMSGRVAAVAVNPKDSRHWVIGAADGGIWQSKNAGQSWCAPWPGPCAERGATGLPTLAIGAVAFSSDGTRIYAGTGEAITNTSGYEGMGIVRSTDTGETWTHHAATQLAGTRFSALLVNPADNRELIAATRGRPGLGSLRGIIRSANSGETWDHERSGGVALIGDATSVVSDPKSGNLSRLFGAFYGGPIWRRGAAGWEAVNAPWPAGSPAGRIELALGRGTNDRLYASVHDDGSGDLLGLWYADRVWDGAATSLTWRQINTSATNDPSGSPRGYCRTQCWYDHRILVDATDDDTLYAGGVSIWRCDSCTTAPQWVNIGNLGAGSTHVDQHALFQVTGAGGAAEFEKYRAFSSFCGSASEGGGVKDVNPAAATVQLSGFTPCDATKYGTVSGTATVSVPTAPLSGTKNARGALILSTPYSFSITANVNWTTGVHPNPNCNSGTAEFCFFPSLTAEIPRASEDQGGASCKVVDDDNGSIRPNSSTSLSVTVACTLNVLDPEGSTSPPGNYAYAQVYLNFHNGSSIYRVFTTTISANYRPKPSTLLVIGNDGGVWSMDEPKKAAPPSTGAWNNHNTNLAITQFYSGALHPSMADVVLGGSQDNGTESRLAAGDAWRLHVGGDGGDVAYSLSDPANQAAAVVGNNWIARTQDSWANNFWVGNGFQPCDANNRCAVDLPFFPRLVKCPSDDNVFLTGSASHKWDNRNIAQFAMVYRNDTFFSAADPPWRENMPRDQAFPRDVTAIAFAPSAGCTTYAAASEAHPSAPAQPVIAITRDSGATWRRISDHPALPNRKITELVFGRTNPNVLWVAFQGFDANDPLHAVTRPGHLFRTSNALDPSPDWQELTPRDSAGARLDLGINAILLDPANPGVVYIGTDLGVMRSVDDGAHWTKMGPETGMPNVAVEDVVTGPTGVIVALTHGRGAFRLDQKSVDLTITKGSNPAPVPPSDIAEVGLGALFTWEIAVRNNGPADATSVLVTDTLPPGVTFDSASGTPGVVCTGTGPVECRIGLLKRGDTAAISIQVRAVTLGLVQNVATVVSDAVDPDPKDNSATAKVRIVDKGADLAITKSHGQDPITVDEEVTYQISVRNNGPEDATDVVVTDTLPADLTFISAAAAPGSCAGTTTVTCTIGALAKGASASVVITVRTTRPGDFTNTARVTGKPSDPVPGNNTATDTLTVTEADLEIVKTATPSSVKVGESVTFHITVKNNGPDRASDVTVTDYLFPDLTLVSATTTQGACGGTPTVVCNLGQIAPGTQVRITIVVTPQKAGRYCNAADLTSKTYDKNKGNNSSTACVDVEGSGDTRCDRAVTKTHSPDPVPFGGRVTFTVTVRNHGPDLTTGVTLTDILPTSIGSVAATASQGSCSAGRPVVCFLGNIASGGFATVTITGTAQEEGLFANRAAVTGNETDPNGGNDEVLDIFRVFAYPAITKLTPASAKQGTRSLELKIEGANLKPDTVVSFQPAAGIEVVAPSVPAAGFVSPVELRRIVHIADNAAVGEREVIVTNLTGQSGGQRPFNVFTVTPGQIPAIRVSPEAIAFGTTPAKLPVDRTLTVQNTGTGTLSVKAMGINGRPMEIVSPVPPFDVGAGSSRNVTLRFNPQVAGNTSRVLVISSNDPARPSVTVPLSGTATAPLAPNADLQPAALNFGTVPQGETRTLGVTLRNTGNANLVLTSAASDSARFAASVALPLSVTAGAQQTFNVTFTPGAQGVVNGRLTFVSNDPEEPSIAFQLRGEGAAPSASESLSLDDGTIETGAVADGLTVVNRFTPTRYPARLTKVSVFFYPFQTLPNPAGAQIRLIAYADASGNPQGNQHPLILLSQTVTIPSVPANGGFLDFDVISGPTVSSGDLYVGFAAPNPAGGVVFSADTNGPQRDRGYFSTDGGATFVGPLVVNTQSGSVPANIMMRATTVAGSAASSCTWGIAPSKLDIPKEGGSGSIDVTAPAGCAWDVTSSSPFLTFAGQRRSPLAAGGSDGLGDGRDGSVAAPDRDPLVSGTGSAKVNFTAAPYTGDTSRSGTVTIASLDTSVGQSAVAPGASGIGSSVFVPIVLSTAGVNNSFFTSELTLTNRGTTSAVFSAAYTAAFGGGGGSAFDVLPPGAQRVYPDGLTYLKSIGTPIPDTGNRGGTVTLSFSNLSSASAGSATVRTSSNVAEGRAGLAYAGVPSTQALNETVYLLGLRQNTTDRSNVALMNAGTQGDVILRVTVYSGEPAAPITVTLADISLPPGGFNQISGILGSNGLSLTNGFVRVQKVGGTAPFYAYAVVNDQANSDGSFVPPVKEASLAGKASLTLPVIVETSAFLSELVATNFGTARKTVRFSLIADAISAASNTAAFTLDLAPSQQVILPNLLQYLRQRGTAGIPAAGATIVGPLFASVDGGDVSGVFVGARTSSAGGGGRYGLFYTAVPTGGGAKQSAWLFGLLQDASNRSNVAFVNTGEVDGSTDVFRLEIFDGETGTLVKTVDGISLPAKKWVQITTVLSLHAPGVTNGYIKVTKTAGNNPFLAYAVVNDGGQPGQRSGDGAFVPMTSLDE